MFGIDERRGPAVGLRGGDDGQRQRGLARGLRPENFDHATTRNTADAECDIKTQ